MVENFRNEGDPRENIFIKYCNDTCVLVVYFLLLFPFVYVLMIPGISVPGAKHKKIYQNSFAIFFLMCMHSSLRTRTLDSFFIYLLVLNIQPRIWGKEYLYSIHTQIKSEWHVMKKWYFIKFNTLCKYLHVSLSTPRVVGSAKNWNSLKLCSANIEFILVREVARRSILNLPPVLQISILICIHPFAAGHKFANSSLLSTDPLHSRR